MRILFITPRMIGDAVIACGVLDHLIRAYPDCRITVATSPAAAGLFDHMPQRERTILVVKRASRTHWLKLWAEVVRSRWDLVVDLKGSGMPFFVRARRRAMRRPGPGRLFEQHAALLGIAPAPLPVVWTGAAERARAAHLIPGDRPVIAICPTASWEPKMWPADRFAALFQALAEEALPGARVAIFAGPGPLEHRLAAPLVAALPEAIDLRGKLTLAEVVACLERCRLYVGNDSGLMHLAAATGVPTVGLRGTSVDLAAEFRPTGWAADWVLGSGESMADISVDEAASLCRRMLASRPTHGAGHAIEADAALHPG